MTLSSHSTTHELIARDRTFVIGTAGHVDHGKSSLVRALTGTDPDRLAEEQRRQMTIDLGFAELVTSAGNHVHIVDVPGHERFVRNMLAGTGGIDAALLVIAADDGPMPQTREHLAILDLLGIEHGVVALSKSDLVEADWLAFVRESIGELLEGTLISSAEIVPVSSQTGFGLSDLTIALDRALAGVTRETGAQTARLPIDRVFTMPGFGAVATGTLLGSSLAVGDRVVVLPSGHECRIRGLQTFGASVETAMPGSRIAVNLSGIDSNVMQRGDVLSLPEAIEPAMRVDARIRLLSASERPIRHNDEVVVFAGAAEIPARVALLEGDEIEAGDDAWVQLRLARPIAACVGDRFVLRRPSPPETIGGGSIVELDSPRHKRNQSGVIERLERLATGDPEDQLEAWLGERIVDRGELDRAPFGGESSQTTLESLRSAGRIQYLDSRFVARSAVLDATRANLLVQLDEFHHEHPLESGPAREQLRESLQLTKASFDSIVHEMAGAGFIEEVGPALRRAGYRIELNATQTRRASEFLDLIERGGFQPPTPIDAGIDPDLVRAMATLGMIVEIGDGIVFTPGRLNEAEDRLLDALRADESISLAEYRDRIGATRKYAQALLEYFDRQRVTRRVGDRRVSLRPLIRSEDTTSP